MYQQKSDNKLKKTGYSGGVMSGFWYISGIVGCIIAVFCLKNFMLPVQAAPATLSSSDAAVYEQMDENSNVVGNLVEGSSFEYTGDVTAEDGSVWRQITTAGGISGYIKGDREIAADNGGDNEAAEENEPEDGDEEEAGDDREDADGDTNAGTNENAGDADDDESAEGTDSDEDDTDTDGESENPEDEDTELSSVYGIKNQQAKSYNLNVSGRIKEKKDIVPAMSMNSGDEKIKKISINVDKTLLFTIAVIFFCGITARISWKKLNPAKSGAGEWKPSDESRNRAYIKNEKKNAAKKRKIAEKSQTRKENQKKRK